MALNSSTRITINCPYCRQKVQAQPTLAEGATLNCPWCMRQFPFSGPKAASAEPLAIPRAEKVRPIIPAAAPAPLGVDDLTIAEPALAKKSEHRQYTAPKYLLAPEENKPSNAIFWIAGATAAIVAVIALGVFYYPDIREKFWPASDDLSANSTAETQLNAKPPSHTITSPVSGSPEKTVEPIGAPVDNPDGNEKAAAKIIPDSEFARTDDAAAKKLREQQGYKRKLAEGKIKSPTGFIHDEGQSSYDKALAEMNTAQNNYEMQRRNAPGRARNAELDHSQQAIDLAFCHGLEAYDYLISKKTLQLKAALDMDTTGITQPELEKIRKQLDVGRWLTNRGEVIWWIGHSSSAGVKYWRNPSFDTTKKGLWAHDRAEENDLSANQKAADKKF